jgi:Spy/CpxP family protein refolding chaperone
MKSRNTYRLLLAAVVILLAYTISMTTSYVIHRQNDKKILAQTNDKNTEIPSEQRTRFFREQLNLTPEQMDVFRDLNRNFNRNGNNINAELQRLRIEMVQELGNENPDSARLDSISITIGNLHAQLKQLTIDYYLDMKENCDEEQQKKLNEIFMSLLKEDEDVSLPRQGGGRYGRIN